MMEQQGGAQAFFPVFDNYFTMMKAHYLLEEIKPQTCVLFSGIRNFKF